MSSPPEITNLLARAAAVVSRPRLPFLGLGLAAIGGIVFAELGTYDWHWLVAATLTLGLVAMVYPRTWLGLLFCFGAFAALHTIRHGENPGRAIELLVRDGPRLADASGIVWSDPEPLPFSRGKPGGSFRLKLTDLQVGELHLQPQAQLAVTWMGELPKYGDVVVLSGALKPLLKPRNPGQFDYGNYLRRQGVFGRIEARYVEDCKITRHDDGNPLVAMALKTRRWMQAQLSRDLQDSPGEAALVSSMVLGMRGETPEEVTDLFRQTGTLHLFAVSGLNIAMLGIIAALVLRPTGLNYRVVAVLIIPILGFYAVITGLSASCIRAAIMGALVLLAHVVERKPNVYNSVCAAAVLILAFDTNQFFAPGFQFSFVLVLTIVGFANRIQRYVVPWGMPDPFLPRPLWNWRQRCRAFFAKLLAASLGVTVASWIGSLAFTAGYFHLFSPSAVAANMVAVPIAFLVLALGLATLLAAPLPAVASLFSNANWGCAKVLLLSVKFFAELPGSHIYVELPRLRERPALELVALDVDDGAAIHLRTDRGDWLIDGGPAWRYPAVTQSYLRSRGVNRLKGLFLTHGDAQHLGAGPGILADFHPRSVFDSPIKDRSSTRKKLHAELGTLGRGESFVQQGDVVTMGSANLRILFPPAGLARNAADDKALVFMIECQGRRILLTSDSGFATEQWLMEHGGDLSADVLIKGQHARDISGTAEFLNRVQPLAIVVSSDDLRRPNDTFASWEQALKTRGIPLFRQDECGAVKLTVMNGKLAISGFVNGQTLTNRAR